jgi:hypothetical protein
MLPTYMHKNICLACLQDAAADAGGEEGDYEEGGDNSTAPAAPPTGHRLLLQVRCNAFPSGRCVDYVHHVPTAGSWCRCTACKMKVQLQQQHTVALAATSAFFRLRCPAGGGL